MSQVLTALRPWRARCHTSLLALDDDGTAPVDDGPIPAVSAGLGLRAPSWASFLSWACGGSEARELAATGLDPELALLAECLRLERAGVGVPEGLLRGGDEAPSPLWTWLSDRLHPGLVVSPAWGPWVDVARVQARLEGAAGHPAIRAAAASGDMARYVASPVPVTGAPGWTITVRIDPTADGVWMIVAARGRMSFAQGPPPTVYVRLELDGPAETHVLEGQDEAVFWYEERPLGSSPRMSAWVIG